MNNFNRKLCAILILNLFLIFSFCCGSSYGYSDDDNWSMSNGSGQLYDSNLVDLWNSYTIHLTTNPRLETLKTQCINMGEYQSGDYYYICAYNSGKNQYYAGCVPKKNIDVDQIVLTYYKQNSRFNFNFVCSANFWDGFKKLAWDMAYDTPSGGFQSAVSECDHETKEMGVLLETDIPLDIVYAGSDGQQHFASKVSPYIFNFNSDLATLNCDNLIIVPNSAEALTMRFNLIDVTDDYKNVITLDLYEYFDEYYHRIDLDNPLSNLAYVIPFNVLPSVNFIDGHKYDWQLVYANGSREVEIDKIVTCSVSKDWKLSSSGSSEGGGDDEDKSDVNSDRRNEELKNSISESTSQIVDSNKETQNKISEQTEAVKENTETNKNIFQKIGDILSILNPFSENFFGKKLVELIINGLKSLFVPEDGFFDTYFSEIREWFSARLGFLWTPFDFVIEILNKILAIDFTEPIIKIPEIKAPFVDEILISPFEYNLNSLKENETFSNIHNIYLAGVDFVIIISLINLARKKIEEVFSN